MEATIKHSMSHFLYQFLNQYAGPGIFGTILLTITFQDITMAIPILSAFLVLVGQAVVWIRTDRRKQARHDLFMKIGQQMVDGKRDFDKDFMEKLDETAD
jgi:hypothetical protein